MENAVRKLKKEKAAGGDGIGNEEWIYGGGELVDKMTKVVNEIWKGGEFPGEWKEVIIAPIYKKGDKRKTENYTRITLMDSGHKIYAEILRNRLESQIEEKEQLSDTQWGFRKGRDNRRSIRIEKTSRERNKQEKRENDSTVCRFKSSF